LFRTIQVCPKTGPPLRARLRVKPAARGGESHARHSSRTSHGRAATSPGKAAWSRTMLQLYGTPRSRAMRCLWMLEEMGEPYQLIEKTTRADELQTAEYLRLNPNARIPTLVDGEVVLWESMAINLYLAQKYEGPMHCVSPKVLGLAAQWSFCCLTYCSIAHCCLNSPGIPPTRNVTSCRCESRWKYSTMR